MGTFHCLFQGNLQPEGVRTLVCGARKAVDARDALFAVRIALVEVLRTLPGVTAAVGRFGIAAARLGPQQGEVAGKGVDHVHIGSLGIGGREIEGPAALRIEEVRDTREVEQLVRTGFVPFDKGSCEIRNLGLPDGLGAGIEHHHQRINRARGVAVFTPHDVPGLEALHLFRVRVRADLVYRIIDLCHFQCILSTVSPRKLWLIHSAPGTTSVRCISSS